MGSPRIKPEDLFGQFPHRLQSPHRRHCGQCSPPAPTFGRSKLLLHASRQKPHDVRTDERARLTRSPPVELQNVTPDGRYKDHFVIINAVGLEPEKMEETQPLERKRYIGLERLFELVTFF